MTSTVLTFSSCENPEYDKDLVWVDPTFAPTEGFQNLPNGVICTDTGNECKAASSATSLSSGSLDSKIQEFKTAITNGNTSSYFSDANNYLPLFQELHQQFKDVRLKLVDGTYKVTFNDNKVVVIYQGNLTQGNVIHAFQF